MKKVYQEIWDERPHACETCGSPVGAYDETTGEMMPRNFEMQHTKKRITEDHAFGKEFIEIICLKCHTKQDQGLNVTDTGGL